MQTNLAASAATRRGGQHRQRASQEEKELTAAAATTDVVDGYRKSKQEREKLSATYHDGDDADAYFSESGDRWCEDGGKDDALVRPHDGSRGVMMPFAGFYEDVNYPVTTLFFPPKAPSEMPPRVQVPRRPGPAYKNDLALCGERENEAQRTVSKVWRGILTRRRLQGSRAYDRLLHYRARMIQCWWRTVVAKRRRDQLAAIKKEWAAKRTRDYIDERRKGLLNMMTWQRSRYEGAAVTIQRVVRWYLNLRARQRCEQADLPESQWPAELPYPVQHRVTRYFPWRRSSISVADAGGIVAPGVGETGDEKPRPRTLLEFRQKRDPVQPPTQPQVESTNAAMRRKAHERAVSLAHPDVQSRLEWKQEGLRKEDLDFNASVIQRFYRAKHDSSEVRTKGVSKTYMDKTVRTIVRSFRMYLLVRRLMARREDTERQVRERLHRYSEDRIAEIDHKMVWGKELLDAAARTIQQCWHWYRYRRFGILPLRIQRELDRRERLASEKQDLAELDEPYEYEEPRAPPYHLIDDHLSREKDLCEAAMSLVDRNRKRMAATHKYAKFTPEKIIVCRNMNTFVPQSA